VPPPGQAGPAAGHDEEAGADAGLDDAARLQAIIQEAVADQLAALALPKAKHHKAKGKHHHHAEGSESGSDTDAQSDSVSDGDVSDDDVPDTVRHAVKHLRHKEDIAGILSGGDERYREALADLDEQREHWVALTTASGMPAEHVTFARRQVRTINEKILELSNRGLLHMDARAARVFTSGKVTKYAPGLDKSLSRAKKYNALVRPATGLLPTPPLGGAFFNNPPDHPHPGQQRPRGPAGNLTCYNCGFSAPVEQGGHRGNACSLPRTAAYTAFLQRARRPAPPAAPATSPAPPAAPSAPQGRGGQ
jgi:hypothetical protein